MMRHEAEDIAKELIDFDKIVEFIETFGREKEDEFKAREINLNEDIGELESYVSALESEISSLENELFSLEDKNETLENEKENLEDEIGSLKNTILELEKS